MNNKGTKYGIILLLLILALTGANLLFGSVNIPAEAVWHILTGNEVEKASWSFIVWESRLPQAITALLCGMALAASGLMLQDVYKRQAYNNSVEWHEEANVNVYSRRRQLAEEIMKVLGCSFDPNQVGMAPRRRPKN